MIWEYYALPTVTWTKMNLGSVIPTFYGSLSVQSVTINPATKEMYVATEGYGMLYAPGVPVPGLTASNFSDIASFPFGTTERVFVNPYNSQDIWVASFGGGIIRGGVGPSNLSATAVSSSQINLSWSDNSSNETAFAIDRATDAGFTQNLVTTTAGQNATVTSITGLSPTTRYYFRIRRTNGPNASANSNPASTTTLAPGPAARLGSDGDGGVADADQPFLDGQFQQRIGLLCGPGHGQRLQRRPGDYYRGRERDDAERRRAVFWRHLLLPGACVQRDQPLAQQQYSQHHDAGGDPSSATALTATADFRKRLLWPSPLHGRVQPPASHFPWKGRGAGGSRPLLPASPGWQQGRLLL